MNRIEEAKKAVESCRTEVGFHASAYLYAEFWMRDLVFSEDVLLRLGYAETIRKQIEAFLRKQRRNGQVPTVLTTVGRRIYNQAFQFWTSDTEILLLIGTMKYSGSTGDSEFLRVHAEELELCLRFVEGKLNRFGFIAGMDWRDALVNYSGRFLLSNQLLLVDMYDMLGRREESNALRNRIQEFYYSSELGHYADYVWWKNEALMQEPRFDCLGNSLAILNGTANGTSAEVIASLYERGRTRFGYRNIFPPCRPPRSKPLTSIRNLNAFVRNGAFLRNRPDNYQNSAIWPFVEARILQALSKLGKTEEADLVSRMILAHDGFNEWYSPVTGAPKGSRLQLWTAASVLEASFAST